MTISGVISLVALAGVSRADLIGTMIEPVTERTYVVVSTTDAAIGGLASYDGQISLGPITLGSDGRYYAISNDLEVERVDPFTGASTFLHGFGDTFPSAAQASRDGVLYSGYIRYGSFYFVGWDIILDEQTDAILPQDDFVAHAAHFRSDGLMIATNSIDDQFYSIDPESGLVTPIGLFEPTEDRILDFAHDAGRDYMLSEDIFGVHRLFEIDLYTLERTLIGEVPDDLYGIAGSTCPADFNGDGVLNVLDFVAFQLAWQAGDVRADVNGDGMLDVLDLVTFQALFEEGCP